MLNVNFVVESLRLRGLMQSFARNVAQSNIGNMGEKQMQKDGSLATALIAVSQLAEVHCKGKVDVYPVASSVNATISGKVVDIKAFMGMSIFTCQNIREQINTITDMLRSMSWSGSKHMVSHFQRGILFITLMASRTITALKISLPYYLKTIQLEHYENFYKSVSENWNHNSLQ